MEQNNASDMRDSGDLRPPQRDPKQGEDGARPPQGPNIFNILMVMFLITSLYNMIFAGRLSESVRQIEYGQFIQLVESGQISRVRLSEDFLQLTLAGDADMERIREITSSGGGPEDKPISATDTLLVVRTDDPALVERLAANRVAFTQTYEKSKSSPLRSFVSTWILPTILLYTLYSFFIRKMMGKMGQGGMGGLFGAGKSRAKEYNMQKSTGVRFADVAGQDEAKESLTEMVDFLHNPQRYQEIGAKQPKGALLVGPPGTGKTLLAKAVAGEAAVPFYSISGSEFVEMFVGVGASRVRDLFEQAKKNSPCIIFIDEIDAIGKSRDGAMVQNDEREQTLNQLLAEMDGFGSESNVIVLAATNRPEVLDKALLRPGRFDRRIIVEKPDLPGREAILKVHAAKVKLDPSVDLRSMALATSGATGADLANMINEAALLAVRNNRDKIAQHDLMESVEVVIAGKEKKDRVMNEKERRMVAYHEVGHALVSALQKKSTPVQKITIVPRTMGSLGYTMNMPEEERYLMTRSELLAQITTLLGGRAAEIVTFGEVTTGASNDIERATRLARNMVATWGMSERFGPVGLESVQNQYLDGRYVSNCSAETGTGIDEEVALILADCEKQAISLLKENLKSLNSISEYLLLKENVSGDEFMSLLNDPA